MLRIIESLSLDSESILAQGRPVPNHAVLEDDDGVRWYLSPGGMVNPHEWTRAYASGASMLVQSMDDGGFRCVGASRFMDERTSVGHEFVLADPFWTATSDWPTIHVLLGQPSPDSVEEVEEKPGDALTGLVHLHTHSEYSTLDGLSTAEEMVAVAVQQGSGYIGMTDHGNCAGHPDLQAACDKAGIKPIFGMEAYLVDDRHRRLDDFDMPEPERTDQAGTEAYKQARANYVKRLRDYWHLVLIATDDTGLRNLWAMSTEAFRDGMYGKNPRLDWDTLLRHREGIIATTACLRGPLLHGGFLDGNTEAGLQRLGKLQEIFGDNLYLEIHANQLPQQIEANKWLAQISQQYQVPLVAAVDSHYPTKEDAKAHRVWLSAQTDSDINDDSSLFAGGQDYHLAEESEVREALSYLPANVVDEAIANTGRIAMRATARVSGEPTPPEYSKGGYEEDSRRLREVCMSNWSKVCNRRNPESVYLDRFEREFDLIERKHFCGYFLMTADMTSYAKRNGILVGPGRGSGGGSLVAYLSGITDIDPVDAELLFERFLTEGRTELPDFDVDYPASKKQIMQQYARDRYGTDAVTVVGSVTRLKNKGVIDKLGRAMSSTLPGDFYLDQKAMSDLIKDAEADTAGLGLSWEDLWSKHSDTLGPYRAKYPDLFAMADRLVGRAFTFGQHAAGLVISTDGALTDSLPLRKASEEGHMIAQFDKNVLEALGYIKFDLLTLRNLDTIQDTIDLIRETRGHEIDVYSWRDEYEDPQVWEEIADGHTLGIFQIETALGTQYASRMRPSSLADLADLVTIVRPGPRNSGLTESYLKRRDGQEVVTYPDPRMESFLSKTYGAMLYQEDIMQATMVLAGYGSDEADKVRKILGKKKVEQARIAGQEFVTRAVANGMAEDKANLLWAQMEEFSKYSFNRAHAYAYAVLAFWCAWLKVHYPVEFLTSALSGIDKDRIPVFIKEARRMGLQVLPPDINESGSGFTPGPLSVRYGLDSIKGVGAAAHAIKEQQPYTSFDDFMARAVSPSGSKVNRGHVALLARVGAFDSLYPNRRGLETLLSADKDGTSSRCVFRQDTIPVGAPNNLPCGFDWESEEPPVNPRTGKKMKPKAPPKRCTKACRNYTAPPPINPDDVPPYTEDDIQQIEGEMLGVLLSSTPFDRLDEQDREFLRDQSERACRLDGPNGPYMIAGVLTKKRPHQDRSGKTMGFLAFETESGTVDVTVFSTDWEKTGKRMHSNTLYLADVDRNTRGFTLRAAVAADRVTK